MIRTLAIIAALALASAANAAPSLDASGKCRDGGKFVKAELCKPKPAAAASKCRDKTTKKFAACSAPNSEPVPVSKPKT